MARQEEMIRVPRSARLPIELRVPDGFDAGDPATWPSASGRLEYVGGRLFFMPPCGEEQALVVPQVAHLLIEWRQRHPQFDVASNEAGMLLGDDARGADVAVWPRPPSGTLRTRRLWRTPPVLAVEVAGADEGDDEAALLEKARWYLSRGVQTVWIVLPQRREVAVVRQSFEQRIGPGERLPPDPALPELELQVDRFFESL